MSAEQGTTARSRSQRAVIPLGARALGLAAPRSIRTRTWSDSWGSVGAGQQDFRWAGKVLCSMAET